MPRKLFTSKEIFFTLMEFNYCYFHFLKIMIIKTTIIIKNISVCQKEIGINLILMF